MLVLMLMLMLLMLFGASYISSIYVYMYIIACSTLFRADGRERSATMRLPCCDCDYHECQSATRTHRSEKGVNGAEEIAFAGSGGCLCHPDMT